MQSNTPYTLRPDQRGAGEYGEPLGQPTEDMGGGETTPTPGRSTRRQPCPLTGRILHVYEGLYTPIWKLTLHSQSWSHYCS